MFKLLFLDQSDNFLRVFQFTTFRAAAAAITALLIVLIIAPKIIAFLRRKKLGENIRDDGPDSHKSKAGTPTMGGILIIIATVLACLLWQDPTRLTTWIGLFAIVGFGIIGFIDDYIKVFKKDKKGLPGRAKLIGQLVVGAIIATALYFAAIYQTPIDLSANSPAQKIGSEKVIENKDGQAVEPSKTYALSTEQTKLFVPFVKGPLFDMGWLWIPFAILLIMFFSNAVNLTDGLDGLATGLMIMVGLSFAIIAYLGGRVDFASYLGINFVGGGSEISVLCMGLVGACVGFLWFNANPATIFMGDTGSLMLGGTLATISLMIKKEVLLVIIGGVFVLEALSVMIQVISYKTRKKRVFLMAPLHHHFELKGWPEGKVVMRFWILGGMFAILGLSTLKVQ